jgi:hypothetical protein
MPQKIISKPIISADSHIMEPPDTYLPRIDKKYKADAPRIVHDEKRGDIFEVPGMKDTIPIGLVAAAGKTAQELAGAAAAVKFTDLQRGSWDPEARMADQDRDGVHAEVIYPSVGMVLCNHPDADYKKACFDAYNLWITEFCGSHDPRQSDLRIATNKIVGSRRPGGASVKWSRERRLHGEGRAGQGVAEEANGRQEPRGGSCRRGDERGQRAQVACGAVPVAGA